MAVRRWACALAAIVLTSLAIDASARERGPLAPPDTSSPQATIRSFTELAEELEQQYTAYRGDRTTERLWRMVQHLDLIRALFDLRQVPPALRLKVGGEAASSLMDVLGRLPPVDLATVPTATPDQWVLPGTEIALIRLPDGPRKGSYVFSAETVDRLPSFRERIMGEPLIRRSAYHSMREEQVRLTGPWVPGSIVEWMPEWLEQTFLGTPRWKVLATLVALALMFVADLAWSGLVQRLRQGRSTPLQLALRLTRPVVLAASLLVFHALVNFQVNIQGHFAEAEFILFAIVCYAAAAWAVWILAFLLVELIIASPRVPDASYDAQLLRLMGQLLALVGSGAIIVYGANDIGIPAVGLVAGLGVGSLAVALAAKPTVENLFGGVTLFADRPFRVGDHISYGTSTGLVEDVGPRSSRIRGLDGTLTTVPNADLATMQITNLSNRNKCAIQHSFGLHYDRSPDQVARLLPELRRRLEAHALVEKAADSPRVRMVGFGPHSVRIDVRATVLTTDFGKFLEVQEQLILEMMKAVEEAGMTLAPAS